jgi:hypothetical protein
MKTLGIIIMLALSVSTSGIYATDREAPPGAQSFDISQTVVTMALAEGVSADDAIDSLQSKAVELNMKFVAHQPLSKELEARGVSAFTAMVGR